MNEADPWCPMGMYAVRVPLESAFDEGVKDDPIVIMERGQRCDGKPPAAAMRSIKSSNLLAKVELPFYLLFNNQVKQPHGRSILLFLQ